MKTTITDRPRENVLEEKDQFGISAYEKGLEDFLRGAETPITVALQGEWGSGKTSLMNVLRYDLCDKEEYNEFEHTNSYYSIWINTWEFSLMRDPKEALLQILFKMAREIVHLSSTPTKELASSILQGVLGLGSAVVKNVANKYIIDGLGDSLQEVLDNGTDNTIAELRGKLLQQIEECLSKNPDKKGIMFFIDDLDRIEPTVAVQLLELLKNIFTLDHCIFILAIDYDVVIKGLKPKFGELNENNEREFRSFFDKIIQVPFSMPVNQYDTDGYLIEELKKLKMIDSTDERDKVFKTSLIKAEQLTIGRNPRSMKRFLNTLSLIKCVNNARKDVEQGYRIDSMYEEENSQIRKLNIFLNFVIVGIQVAYPRIYQLLCIEPGFTLWDQTVASKMGMSQLDTHTQERLANFEQFDETWEQTLYRVCLSDKYLIQNAINISQLFNMVRNEIRRTNFEDELSQENQAELDKTIKEYIQEQMSQASVTGYMANDTTPLEYNAGELMRKVQWQIHEYLHKAFKDVVFSLRSHIRRNGGISTESNCKELVIWQENPTNHEIRFAFRLRTNDLPQEGHEQYLPSVIPIEWQKEDICNLKDIDLSVFKDLLKFGKAVEASDCYKLWIEREILNNGFFFFDLNFDVTFDNKDSFLEPRTIKIMQEVSKMFFEICFKLNN